MTNLELSNLLFPNAKDIEFFENKYPERNLPEGAVVTRFAPSPTGFVHIGGLLQCIVERVLVERKGGVLMLRIEDTDQKRKIENGVAQIVDSLKDFDITFDEGMLNETEYVGEYGPYIQSQRKDIYEAYVKHLVSIGRAYPCFATEEELETMRETQREQKVVPGYYGKWAIYRNLSTDEAAEKIKNGIPYVIRFKSMGNPDEQVVLHDQIRGNITFPQNEMDIVILKNDGLPTYHFAHVVDDHLMHTTHVIRSDEWISSAPIHLELFNALGFKTPKYCHYSPMLKEEDGKKRKISKRKDPEAAVSFYHELGVPTEAIKEYLMCVASSAFEEWRMKNPNADIYEFPFKLEKMGISGTLFDMNKVIDISKDFISKLSPNEIFERYSAWAEKYSDKMSNIIKNTDYAGKVLSIERDENGSKRKDIANWSDVENYIGYMFDEFFENNREYPFQVINNIDNLKVLFDRFLKTYDENDSNEDWFNKVKDIAEEMGFARDFKLWKKDKEAYPGHVGDLCTAIRIAVSGRTNTPDLYTILKILGRDRISKRFQQALKSI